MTDGDALARAREQRLEELAYKLYDKLWDYDRLEAGAICRGEIVKFLRAYGDERERQQAEEDAKIVMESPTAEIAAKAIRARSKKSKYA